MGIQIFRFVVVGLNFVYYNDFDRMAVESGLKWDNYESVNDWNIFIKNRSGYLADSSDLIFTQKLFDFALEKGRENW